MHSLFTDVNTKRHCLNRESLTAWVSVAFKDLSRVHQTQRHTDRHKSSSSKPLVISAFPFQLKLPFNALCEFRTKQEQL